MDYGEEWKFSRWSFLPALKIASQAKKKKFSDFPEESRKL